ncbi:MAG TPA: CHAT domain-containing protein [Polyangiaceae bacterium]|nr:CHAT domain-containing protein [Polyangiaceae bacterium]
MDYLDFNLEVRALSGARCRVTVRSPQGDHDDEIELPASPDALGAERARLHGEAWGLASGARGAGRAGGAGAWRDLRPEGGPTPDAGELGRALYEAVFRGRVAELFAANRAHAGLLGRGVRIKLVTPDASIALVPWELLCPRRGDGLCLSGATPLVRHVLVGRPQVPLRVEPPLRVLGVLSTGGGAPLDLARERACVSAELAPLCRRGLAELEWLEAPTSRDLLEALDRKEWHVLHFAGHGAFDRDSAQGLLSIEAGRGHLRASDLRVLLRDRPSLRLVFLNSCEGAVGDARELFSSTAALVAEAGVPAVLAMQFPISDEAATRFAERVYRQIAAGASLEKAAAEARKDISMGGSFEWATPVLFMRSAGGALLRVSSGDVAAPGGAGPTATPGSPRAEAAWGPAPAGTTPDDARSLAPARQPRRPLRTWLACLAFAGAATTAAAAVLPCLGGGAGPASADEAGGRGGAAAGVAKRVAVELKWGGTECEGRPAEVAVGACHDRRPLGWLGAELRGLVASGKVNVAPGGHQLLRGAAFKLVSNSSAPDAEERNKYVFVCDREASFEACSKSEYYLTIGWHGDGAPRDGAVRVYKRGGKLVLGPIYYSADGAWWAEGSGRGPPG